MAKNSQGISSFGQGYGIVSVGVGHGAGSQFPHEDGGPQQGLPAVCIADPSAEGEFFRFIGAGSGSHCCALKQQEKDKQNGKVL